MHIAFIQQKKREIWTNNFGETNVVIKTQPKLLNFVTKNAISQKPQAQIVYICLSTSNMDI